MDIQNIQNAVKPTAAVKQCHAADFLEQNTLDEHRVRMWTPMTPTPNPLISKFPRMRFHDENDAIVTNIVSHKGKISQKTVRRAGPTPMIQWDPADVRAGIVTCGGLCPGLNSIIRDVTIGLYSNYGLRSPGSIIGFRNGYNGFNTEMYPPMVLTPAVVEEIHTKGGSILGAGRGGFDPDFIVDTLLRLGINHLYVVGGDGTQWAADIVFQVIKERGLKISIIGIPKTIDNDILFFDRSFGFHTAVDAGVAAIHSAFVEASSCFNGVGIVKLMGRDSGFVARNAALASNLVDAVLVPEVDFILEGKGGLLEHISYRLKRKGHAVIVVAEGAGQKYCATSAKDETGHTVYGDIGNVIKTKVNDYLKKTVGGRCFFIDPSYMIRSIPATPNDNLYCARMAHEAVHAAMRGYSGICVGSIHDYMVMVPMKEIASGRRAVNVYSSVWQRLCEATGMPSGLTGHDRPKAILTMKKRGTPEIFRAKKRAAKL